jgi:hypothetical protein
MGCRDGGCDDLNFQSLHLRRVFMKYCRPDIGENSVAYKGRRYWVIELAPNGEFDWMDNSFGEYARWDGLFDAIIATIKLNNDLKFTRKIVAHVDFTSHEFASFPEAVGSLAAEYDWYSKMVSG